MAIGDYKNLNGVFIDIGEQIVEEFKDHADKHRATGKLYRSIKFNIKKNMLIVQLAKHAIYLDKGTRPHMPPVDKIKKWAASKGINVWALAKSIAKKGTKAYPFLYRFDDIANSYIDDIAEAYSKDIIYDIDKTLIELKIKK
ncbi:MAG: hypothetical protein ACD_33C00022G0001 [uncultured bacterium]|nr:MAG: hypothetical protein ACD_33C00022G0001 [uncultured bacterium]